jgi:adenine/guanine phosphoribosyltransferase-like PRPP-binding protein
VYLLNDLLCIGSVASAYSEVAAHAVRVAEAGKDNFLDCLLRGARQGAPPAVILCNELDLVTIRVPRLYLSRVVLRDKQAYVVSRHGLHEDAVRLAHLLLEDNQKVVLGFQERTRDMVPEGRVGGANEKTFCCQACWPRTVYDLPQ